MEGGQDGFGWVITQCFRGLGILDVIYFWYEYIYRIFEYQG